MWYTALELGLINGSDATQGNNPALSKIETPNVKKRHKRMKSSGAKNLDNMDGRL